MIGTNLVHSSMMSRTNKDPSTHAYGLNFVLVSVILLFFFVPTVLNCNKDYNFNNVGFAISQKHNDDVRVNVVSKGEATIPSHYVTKANETNSNLHSNASKTTSNDKLVILTFGDTIKNQITTAKPILDQYGIKASFFITCDFASGSSSTR